nr:MAG TPA: hypothetical protein [Caudoviricetes sp.]
MAYMFLKPTNYLFCQNILVFRLSISLKSRKEKVNWIGEKKCR